MAKTKKLTPMMEQYMEIRNDLASDTLLLFRLGDFYEMFHEDAIEGSRILGITLTQRHDYPMAGMPYHAADNYVGKLLAAGKKVAICDQLETPVPGKLVKRSLTRILSAGTTIADNQITAEKNHFLASLLLNKNGLHLAWLDLTTGNFQIASDKNPESLLPVLTALDPSEIVVVEDSVSSWKANIHESPIYDQLVHLTSSKTVSELPPFHFEIADGAKIVMETLGVLNLEGFGIKTTHPALGPAGALLHYATENLCAKPENLGSIREYRSVDALLVDPSTLRNLEIFESSRGNREGSLMQAMDATSTAAGARLLEEYLISPTLDIIELQRRQKSVGAFIEESGAASRIKEQLGSVRDISRILGRLQNRLRNPRELGGIRDTIRRLPGIRAVLTEISGESVLSIWERISEFEGLTDLLSRGLKDELPGQLQDGGYIRPGFDEDLDHLLSLTSDNRTWLSDLENSERERSGIKNLKIKFNNAFGYFIEITKSNLASVPENYVRKQTMVNCERFVTEDLKQKEKEILHAEEKSKAREIELFGELVDAVLAHARELQRTSVALAELDLFIGWATLAREWDYCCPELDHSDEISISEGRHPVVEQMMKKEDLGLAGSFSFVPNDASLNSTENQLLIITGPNMAGKSTYIRQVALITLMAQVGSWVPASKCAIGIVDRIFSRVGANDELARGNSTFMVEMNETANILNNTTDRSLIILDEIGRGTSTYDGLSIAWAVVEHLHRDAERGPRTLFATHYQELTQLEKFLPRLKNFSVSVKEWNDEIVFVRRIVPGPADRSYGIQVARLAGLPTGVIDRAKVILHNLESEEGNVSISAPQPVTRRRNKISVTADDGSQLDLF
jgi:DNA mismatch repair protein MutS